MREKDVWSIKHQNHISFFSGNKGKNLIITFKARIGQYYKWGCIKYDWDTDFPNFDVSLSILYISSSILSQSYKSNQKILLLLRGRPPKPSQIIYIYI